MIEPVPGEGGRALAAARTAAGAPAPESAQADLVASDLDFNPGAGSDGCPLAGNFNPGALLADLRAQRERLRANLAALEARIEEVGRLICPRCAATGRYRVRGGLYGETQRWPCNCPIGRRAQPSD